MLLEALVSDAVNVDLVSFGHEPTTLARARVDAEGRAVYDFEVEGSSAPALTREMVPESLDPAVKALCVGSLGLVLEPIATTLVDLVEREAASRVVIMDPNIRTGLTPERAQRERLRRVIASSTIVKASDDDLAWMFRGLDVVDAATELCAAGVRLVVVTSGPAGAFALHQGNRVAVPAAQTDVVDTIGAGDTFGAALVAWLYEHDVLVSDLSLNPGQLKEALEFACLAAAVTCGRRGADPPWRREVATSKPPAAR